MKEILNRLITDQALSAEEAKDVLVRITNNEFPATQVAAFLTVYMMREVTTAELTGFRNALLELCKRPSLDASDAIDLCGTGGDGKNTFNISTISAFLVAGAGYRVIKHGNYGVSSLCGSSNVLEHIGYSFTNDEDVLQRQLDKLGITFLHAPLFHPAMGSVAPIRKELGTRTFFNMLGPLVNPVQPDHQLTGVFSLGLQRNYAEILRDHRRNYMVLHGTDGYDELTLTGKCKVTSKHGESIHDHTTVSIARIDPIALHGGSTVEESARILNDILDGNGTDEQNDVVVANAGLAIQCMEPLKELNECMDLARTALESKIAGQIKEQLIELS